jgi:hypothetical protein
MIAELVEQQGSRQANLPVVADWKGIGITILVNFKALALHCFSRSILYDECGFPGGGS